MRIALSISLWLLPLLLFGFNGEFSYIQIKAEEGDGVYSLHRSYGLNQSSCNHRQFYKLNKTHKGKGLIKGKMYMLPILEFKYNGTSIRSTLDSNDMQFAIAIKAYNVDLQKRGIKKLLYKDDHRLWIPYEMLHCGSKPALSRPVKPRVKTIELFGKEHEKVIVKDKSLEGRVFYIVAGHGGPDPGTTGASKNHMLCEDEYAYDVSLRLTKKLIEHGAIAYMINRDKNDGIRDDKYLECDYDELLYDDVMMSRNQIVRLRQRTNAINRLYNKHKKQGINSQTVLSIHIDSRAENQKADVFFIHHDKSVKGNLLADRFHDVFAKKYKKYQSTRGYKGNVQGRNLFVLRESKPLAVLVELGNIKNTHDQKRILLASNRQALAEWLYEGLISAP